MSLGSLKRTRRSFPSVSFAPWRRGLGRHRFSYLLLWALRQGLKNTLRRCRCLTTITLNGLFRWGVHPCIFILGPIPAHYTFISASPFAPQLHVPYRSLMLHESMSGMSALRVSTRPRPALHTKTCRRKSLYVPPHPQYSHLSLWHFLHPQKDGREVFAQALRKRRHKKKGLGHDGVSQEIRSTRYIRRGECACLYLCCFLSFPMHRQRSKIYRPSYSNQIQHQDSRQACIGSPLRF